MYASYIPYMYLIHTRYMPSIYLHPKGLYEIFKRFVNISKAPQNGLAADKNSHIRDKVQTPIIIFSLYTSNTKLTP